MARSPASGGLPWVERATGEDVEGLPRRGVGLGPTFDHVTPVGKPQDLRVLDAAPVVAFAAETQAFFGEDHYVVARTLPFASGDTHRATATLRLS